MLKAIFLDMDETLCDTTRANKQALRVLATAVNRLYPQLNEHDVANDYIKGIYRNIKPHHADELNAIADEGEFRIALVRRLLIDAGIDEAPRARARELQITFDEARTAHFDFYPGIKEWLIQARKSHRLILITNGPEYSQILKVKRVEMDKYVDHIIIGGQEKEQKPAVSIFEKAMRLAHCNAHETVHVGDSLTADIAGANAASIASVWIRHTDSNDLNLDTELANTIIPTHILDSPQDIPQFFRDYSA
ncbi:MAG: HAD-IA family hydrolase [Pseudomonadota bacterium]